MLLQHKITKQIIDTDKVDEYLATGVWELIKAKDVDGIFGDIRKEQLLQMTALPKSAPKSLVVDELKTDAPLVNVEFTDDLV